MNDVARILSAIDEGDRQAAAELLPLVYDELRRLAARKLAAEKPGQTLDATALVHEAYLRLVNRTDEARWDSEGHFFVAAAEAMRRILVENARRKQRVKHGGSWAKVELTEDPVQIDTSAEDLISLDEALTAFAEVDSQAAELVKLRYFAGLTMQQAADLLGVSLRTAHRNWAFARSWLYRRIHGSPD